MIAIWAIIWTLLALLILLSALLLTPVRFSAQAGLDETASFEAALVWAGDLASFQAAVAGGQPLEMRLRLGRWTRQLQTGESKNQKDDAKRGRSKQPESTAKSFDLAWINKAGPYLDKQVLKEVFRYLFLLERSLSLRLNFEGEIGLGDLELTGYLAGLLATLNSGQWKYNLRPNFTDTVLRFQGTVQGRIRPSNLFWLTGRLLLSPPVRSTWWLQLRTPKKQNRDQGDMI